MAKAIQGFQEGEEWKSSYGDSYKITGRYSIKSHLYYHITLNGKHIGEKAVPSSVRLIPEAEVFAMKR
jgi:hypothetical protein